MTRRFAAHTILLLSGAFLLAGPLAAKDDGALAEKRLRGCLATGATSAPGTDLASAVVSTRAFCARHIDRVYAMREAAAHIEDHDGEARRAIRRATDEEIVLAIANFSGRYD